MKLEVGKRYVMRNGEVTGPLIPHDDSGIWLKDSNRNLTWMKQGGFWSANRNPYPEDIVFEYSEPCGYPINEVEPQPQQPLRWVENCKPDKPGIWAQLYNSGNIGVQLWFPCDINGVEHAAKATRCYLGPIPEILPPKKKVVERLWVQLISCEPCDYGRYKEAWFVDGETIQPPGDWIRTDRTREREI